MYSSVINKFLYLELRLFIMTIISIVIIVSDGKYNMFVSFKNYIEDSVCLFYRLCYQPIYVLDYISQMLFEHRTLILKNDALHKELILKNSELLLMDFYKQENYKLRDLLCSPICKDSSKLVTQIFFTNINTFTEQAIIKKGIDSGIYVGQPVLSDVGVVGQIISVNNISSRVLLISDPSHALSVKSQRNNIPIILSGCGHNMDLKAEYFGNIDICVNDILITSGLDDRFPAGYPVAIVSNIKNNFEKDLTIIRARPIVKLQYLRYIVLIWA